MRIVKVTISDRTRWLILEVALEDGTVGFGEATFFGWEEAIEGAVASARRAFQGQFLRIPGEALAMLDSISVGPAGNVLRNALEQALLDVLSQRANVPLCALLGGPMRRSVPVYANINRGTTDRSAQGFARRAHEVVSENEYLAIKIAPFDALDRTQHDFRMAQRRLELGVERIIAVRDAIGSEVQLLIDCHQRLNFQDARTVLQEAASGGVYWIEDAVPLTTSDVEAMRSFRSFANNRGTRVAGGETLSTVGQAMEVLDGSYLDVILPDLRFAGPRDVCCMFQMAKARGVEASLHSPAGPVLDLISLQVAAAAPSFLLMERQVGETPHYERIRGELCLIEGGQADVDMSGGIGRGPARNCLTESSEDPMTTSH